MDLKSGIYMEPIPWSNAYPSHWELKANLLKDDFNFVLYPKLSIGKFSTELEFLLETEKLAEELVNKYCKVYRGIKKTIEPSRHEFKITDPESGGFNLTKFQTLELATGNSKATSDAASIRIPETLRAMTVSGINETIEETYYWIVTGKLS